MIALALLGCGPARQPIPVAHVPVRVERGDSSEVRLAERRYLAAGLPPLAREVRVRVFPDPYVTPGSLPVGSAVPGALGGTWVATGDIDVVDVRYLPHEMLHAAKIIAGDPTGDRDHRDPLWSSVPEGR